LCDVRISAVVTVIVSLKGREVTKQISLGRKCRKASYRIGICTGGATKNMRRRSGCKKVMRFDEIVGIKDMIGESASCGQSKDKFCPAAFGSRSMMISSKPVWIVNVRGFIVPGSICCMGVNRGTEEEILCSVGPVGVYNVGYRDRLPLMELFPLLFFNKKNIKLFEILVRA
jgi:hypothetical protein